MNKLDFAKNLQASQSDRENIVWKALCAKRLSDAKFKRQQPLGRYIVDFVCFECRLIVEIDGGQHNGSVDDVLRDEWLGAQGFTVLRFWNNEVMENLEGVLTRVFEFVEAYRAGRLVEPAPSVEPDRGFAEPAPSLQPNQGKKP